MGSPVEDGHHHKGLGMILSSKQGESDKVKDSVRKEDHSQKPGLAATLQSSPSDHGYSYTEALFTGAPLLNGSPFAESDRTHALQSGSSVEQTVKGNDKPADNYKSTGSVTLNVDKSNGHYEGEANGQVQKEVHTQDGVWGIAMNTRPNESHPSSETGKEEHTNTVDNVEHQYLIPRPSLDASPYKSHGKVLGTAKYTQIDQMADSSSRIENHKWNPSSADSLASYPMRSNQYQHGEKSAKTTLSDHPVERVHQILVTGETQENFATKPYDSGPSAEEQKVNNRVPDKTYIKAYDEESNLLGSSVLHRGKLEDQHGVHVVGRQHHEFNPKVLTGSTDYWKTHNIQTEYSSHKAGMDTSPSDLERFEKETDAVSLEVPSNALSNDFKINEGISQAGGQTSARQEHRGHQPFYQNYGQHMESHLKDASESNSQESHGVYEARKIPNVKSNDSLTMPLEGITSSKGSSGFGTFINQLRPHKIIESAFDEELTHRIITGPSNEQISSSVPIKQSTEKQTEDNTFLSGKSEERVSSPPSLPFREGGNPTTLSQESDGLSKATNEGTVEPLSPTSSEAATDESLNNNHNEEETQQTTSNHFSSTNTVDARPEHEDVFTNDASSQKEQENTEASQSVAKHGSDASNGSGEISNNSARQPSNQNEAIETEPQLPYGEDSSSTPNSLQHEMLSKGQGQQSIEASLGSNEAEATTQKETSHHQLSGSAVDTTPDHENTVANGADSQGRPDEQTDTLQSSVTHEPDTNNGRSDNSYTSQEGRSNELETNKEIEASLQYGEAGNHPDMFGHGNAGEQLVKASPPSAEEDRVGSSNNNTGETRQQDKSLEGSSENSSQEQQQVESSQSSNEQDNDTNSGTSENFPGHVSSQREANQEMSSSSYREGSRPETEQFGNEQMEQPEQASPARVVSSNGSSMEASMQQGTSYQADHEGAFTEGVSKQEESKETETSLTNAEHEIAGNYEPSENSRNSPELNYKALNDKQRHIKVGTPEEAKKIPTADQTKEVSEGQVLIPFYGAKIHSHSASQGMQNNQSKGNDQDNKNQRIVYFLKMAKGIPLLNSRKAAHYAEGKNTGTRGPGEHSTSTVTKEEHRVDSTPETDVDVNGGRRYPWRWQRRPSRRPRPQTSWRPSPRPQPVPSPSPYPSPSPSTGGGGGALGGSSVDSNQPQGNLPALNV